MNKGKLAEIVTSPFRYYQMQVTKRKGSGLDNIQTNLHIDGLEYLSTSKEV